MDEQTTINLGDLVLDYAVYPRHRVDDHHVTRIADALAVGRIVPPLVIDRRSHRVADGFHRYEAYRRTATPGTPIPVIIRDYASDAELFEDSIRLNAQHGRPLSAYDLSVVVVRAEQFGLTRDHVAGILAMTPTRLEDLTRDRAATTVTREPVILKRSVRHLAGTALTPVQVDTNEHLVGWSPRFLAHQLVMLIDAQMLDLSDEATIAELERLYLVLGSLRTPSLATT